MDDNGLKYRHIYNYLVTIPAEHVTIRQMWTRLSISWTRAARFDYFKNRLPTANWL